MKSLKPPAQYFFNSIAVQRRAFEGVDQSIHQNMGQMTDHAKQTIVRAWIHDLDFGADFAPERRDFFQRLPIGPTGRRENTTMAHEEIRGEPLEHPTARYPRSDGRQRK